MYIYKFYTDFSLCPENVKPINVIVRIVTVSFPELITITILTITLVHLRLLRRMSFWEISKTQKHFIYR